MSIEFSLYIGFFVFYAIVALIFVVNGFRVQRIKEKNLEKSATSIRPESITVIVPFRNEAKRIPELLQSINELKQRPGNILFVDDHSTDAGVEVIHDQLSTDVNYTVLSVNDEVAGKKAAIRYASTFIQTEYTLTWDADIRVQSDYFNHISKLPDADMYVLPAILEPKRPLQALYEIDVLLANAVNSGLAGMYRPIFASGANLLYTTKCFETYDTYDSHRHVSSGDDTFLLRDFTVSDAAVHLHTSPELAVYTETPQSFGEYIQQRLRWVSKTKALSDSLNTSTAIVQLILTVGFFGILALAIVQQQWVILVWLLTTKIALDMYFFYPYCKRLGRLKTWLWIPLYELWFPVYSMLIAVLLPFYRPKWKGRAVTTK